MGGTPSQKERKDYVDRTPIEIEQDFIVRGPRSSTIKKPILKKVNKSSLLNVGPGILDGYRKTGDTL